MSHNSSLRKDQAVATAAVLNVVTDKEPAPVAEPFRLHVAVSKVQYTVVKKSSKPSRRYTIDDNGGSYEGL